MERPLKWERTGGEWFGALRMREALVAITGAAALLCIAARMPAFLLELDGLQT